MSKWGKVDFTELRELDNRIQKFINDDFGDFMEEVARELASRLLGKVIPRTPVGQYPPSSGRVGGTLRKGWTGGVEMSPKDYVESLKVVRKDGYVEITVINPVFYAKYVEMGHRTSNHKSWVKGQHFLRISENELENQSPAIIQRKLSTKLKEVFI